MDSVKTLAAVAGHRDHARRAVVAALGGMVLGGVLTPALASKKTRKAVKRAKKQGDKKCRKQDGQCVQGMTEVCNAANADPANAAICVTKFAPCCAFLADCQTTAFFDCALAK
ncbi:MAG: hypothetical protein M3Z20_19680 [Chloroflexota bacterium]|nr:hypothetical protein [Chloroflexota bacterium]